MKIAEITNVHISETMDRLIADYYVTHLGLNEEHALLLRCSNSFQQNFEKSYPAIYNKISNDCHRLYYSNGYDSDGNLVGKQQLLLNTLADISRTFDTERIGGHYDRPEEYLAEENYIQGKRMACDSIVTQLTPIIKAIFEEECS